MSVCVRSLAVTSHPRESCFLVSNSVTVSIVYAKSQPTKCENVPLCNVPQLFGPFRDISTQRCQLDCKLFLYFSAGEFYACAEDELLFPAPRFFFCLLLYSRKYAYKILFLSPPDFLFVNLIFCFSFS